MTDKDKIPLSDAIANLREQLQTAMEDGENEKLRFEIQELELELTCGVSRGAKGDAKIKFWLIEAGAEGKMSNEVKQKVKLKLKPKAKDGKEILLNDVDTLEELSPA
ncbi:MAG TPA: trypco2 family protein [Chitinispirillaceae bacterium]|nr:trypco2 family protein [Chitinispirillaceae bacterium]